MCRLYNTAILFVIKPQTRSLYVIIYYFKVDDSRTSIIITNKFKNCLQDLILLMCLLFMILQSLSCLIKNIYLIVTMHSPYFIFTI